MLSMVKMKVDLSFFNCFRGHSKSVQSCVSLNQKFGKYQIKVEGKRGVIIDEKQRAFLFLVQHENFN